MRSGPLAEVAEAMLVELDEDVADASVGHRDEHRGDGRSVDPQGDDRRLTVEGALADRGSPPPRPGPRGGQPGDPLRPPPGRAPPAARPGPPRGGTGGHHP